MLLRITPVLRFLPSFLSPWRLLFTTLLLFYLLSLLMLFLLNLPSLLMLFLLNLLFLLMLPLFYLLSLLMLFLFNLPSLLILLLFNPLSLVIIAWTSVLLNSRPTPLFRCGWSTLYMTLKLLLYGLVARLIPVTLAAQLVLLLNLMWIPVSPILSLVDRQRCSGRN